MKQEDRHLYKRKRKRKFNFLKNTGQLSNYYKQKLEAKKPKVVQSIKEENIMPKEKTKRLLLFFPADKLISRILRRGVVVAVLTFLVFVGQEVFFNYGHYVPSIWIPVVTGILAALDKTLRELIKN